MYLVMKIDWFFQFIFQIKNLKIQWNCIQWICYFQLIIITHIIYTLKILTDLYFTKQKIKIKNGFVRVAYSVLVVKIY